jgi:hypothetical protein
MALSFCGIVTAGDYEKTQHNVRFKQAYYAVELRQETNSLKDHYQIMYYGIKNFEFRYRYVDNPQGQEHRPMISYLGLRGDIISLTPRLDYRHFEGTAPNYISFRTAVTAQKNIGNFNLYGNVIPIWNIGAGSTNDAKIDNFQFRLGFDYRTPYSVSMGPFIQYETDSNLEKTNVFLGTAALVDF